VGPTGGWVGPTGGWMGPTGGWVGPSAFLDDFSKNKSLAPARVTNPGLYIL
jgi:hypothetical protein